MRRIFLVGLFIFVMFNFPAVLPCNASQVAPNPLIQEMMDSVSVARIEAHLRALEGFYTRHTNSDTLSDTLGIGAARRYIFDQFQAISDSNGGRLQVGYFDFVETVQGITREHRNVVAILPGTQQPDSARVFLVSGHMDSRCEVATDFNCFAPGATDDASGTVASIELAQVMVPHQFDATLIFMTVTGEDQPGIIRQISARLAQDRIDITDLYALRDNREQSFVMVMELAVPRGVDTSALQREFVEIGNTFGLSATVQHENVFSAANDPRPVWAAARHLSAEAAELG